MHVNDMEEHPILQAQREFVSSGNIGLTPLAVIDGGRFGVGSVARRCG